MTDLMKIEFMAKEHTITNIIMIERVAMEHVKSFYLMKDGISSKFVLERDIS